MLTLLQRESLAKIQLNIIEAIGPRIAAFSSLPIGTIAFGYSPIRSEIKGDMQKLENRVGLQIAENLRILRDFEKRLEKLTVEIKNLEMSVR